MCVCVLLYVFYKVEWTPEPEPNKHCSQMLVKHALTVFGRHWPLLDVNVVARQVITSVSSRGHKWTVYHCIRRITVFISVYMVEVTAPWGVF